MHEHSKSRYSLPLNTLSVFTARIRYAESRTHSTCQSQIAAPSAGRRLRDARRQRRGLGIFQRRSGNHAPQYATLFRRNPPAGISSLDGFSGDHDANNGNPMPIRINLDVMLACRKIKSYELAAKIGIIPQNLSILKTGKARAIRMATLGAICRHLQCQPGDILKYVEEGEEDEEKN